MRISSSTTIQNKRKNNLYNVYNDAGYDSRGTTEMKVSPEIHHKNSASSFPLFKNIHIFEVPDQKNNIIVEN